MKDQQSVRVGSFLAFRFGETPEACDFAAEAELIFDQRKVLGTRHIFVECHAVPIHPIDSLLLSASYASPPSRFAGPTASAQDADLDVSPVNRGARPEELDEARRFGSPRTRFLVTTSKAPVTTSVALVSNSEHCYY